MLLYIFELLNYPDVGGTQRNFLMVRELKKFGKHCSNYLKKRFLEFLPKIQNLELKLEFLPIREKKNWI